MSYQKSAQRIESRLGGLTKLTRRKAELFIILASDQGIPVRITQAYRSGLEQAALYAQGRESRAQVNALRKAAGMCPLGLTNRKVTNANRGQSNHEKGIAFDIVPMKLHDRLLPNWGSPNWKKLGEIGETLGLQWGGRWRKPDRPHFQSIEEDA